MTLLSYKTTPCINMLVSSTHLQSNCPSYRKGYSKDNCWLSVARTQRYCTTGATWQSHCTVWTQAQQECGGRQLVRRWYFHQTTSSPFTSTTRRTSPWRNWSRSTIDWRRGVSSVRYFTTWPAVARCSFPSWARSSSSAMLVIRNSSSSVVLNSSLVFTCSAGTTKSTLCMCPSSCSITLPSL